jgi:hypothetical protein
MNHERFRVFRPGSTTTGEAELIYRQGVWAAVACLCNEPGPAHFFVMHIPTGRPCSEPFLSSDDAINGVRTFGRWPDVGKDLSLGDEVPAPTGEQIEYLKQLAGEQPPQISVVMLGTSDLPPEIATLVTLLKERLLHGQAPQSDDKTKMN